MPTSSFARAALLRFIMGLINRLCCSLAEASKWQFGGTEEVLARERAETTIPIFSIGSKNLAIYSQSLRCQPPRATPKNRFWSSGGCWLNKTDGVVHPLPPPPSCTNEVPICKNERSFSSIPLFGTPKVAPRTNSETSRWYCSEPTKWLSCRHFVL
jgi:hypothetical protein